MPWQRTQLNASLISRRSPLKSSTLAFLFVFSSLVAFVPLSSSASDSDYIEEVASVEGLDPRGLSLMVSGLQASGASTGNITNDVASILSILESTVFVYGSARIRTTEYPFANQNTQLGRLLNLLFSSTSNAGTAPAATDSYLYQIRELLKDASFTNDLANVEYWLDHIWQDAEYLYPIYDYFVGRGLWLNDLESVLSNSLTNWWDEFRYNDGLWNTHIDSSQWEDLMYTLSSISDTVGNQDSPFDDSAWNDYADDVGHMAVDIADILYYVEHIDQDIHDEMIADSAEISQASSETAQIEYEEESGQDAFEDQLADDTSDAEDLLADNEPDYEVHYTENPMEPLTNAVNFRSRMERHLPDLDSLDTSDKTRVYLFKTEWDTEGLLTRSSGNRSRSGMQWNGLENVYFDLSGSDPRVPNQLLNYASTAMAWAWNLSACILAFLMLRQFWDWVASWRA